MLRWKLFTRAKKRCCRTASSSTTNRGIKRTDIRARWYLSPRGHTYRSYALQAEEIDCDVELDKAVVANSTAYPTTAKPVSVGHYWLRAKRAAILADNVACLNYSVAKGGLLCAYRWPGEQTLSNDHFGWVSAKS